MAWQLRLRLAVVVIIVAAQRRQGAWPEPLSLSSWQLGVACAIVIIIATRRWAGSWQGRNELGHGKMVSKREALMNWRGTG